MRYVARLICAFRRFRRDQGGVSAVEFAMVLPLMVILFVGVIQVSEVIAAKRKTTLVARAVADLVAQVQSINQTELNNVMAAGRAIIVPFRADRLSIRISGVNIDSNGKATIDWSKVNSGNPDFSSLAKNSPVALDDALKIPDSYLIMAEVAYTHPPAVGYGLTGALGLVPDKVTDKIYMWPRVSKKVTCC